MRIANSRKARSAFAIEARRTHSYEMRDVLTRAATGSRLSQEQFRESLDNVTNAADVRRFVRAYRSDLNLNCLLATAQTFYLQRIRDSDIRHSTIIYDIVEERWGRSKIVGADRSFYADGLNARGELLKSQEILKKPDPTPKRYLSHRFLLENTRNSFVHGEAASEPEKWLDELNRHYEEAGLAPFVLDEGDAVPFLRLSTVHSLPYVDDGPLVSILMPIYQPDDSTDLAIASLLAQTWRNLELVIVDDGSPAIDGSGNRTNYAERLRRWERADSRVRLTLNRPNRGAYTVRNIAYSQARGDFVTVADKDDWHHPQRIQLQVEDLLSRGAVANTAHWVRADNNLRFLIRTAPDQVVHTSFPSLMFRREVVQEKLGFWDEVRKGGDTEYMRRLETVFFEGKAIKGFRVEPLMVSLMGEGNLTAGDNALGYFSESRRHYRAGYRPWHRAIAEGEDSYLPQSETPRRIDAPSSFLPETSEPPHYEYVLVGDFSQNIDGQGDLLRDELRALISSGKRVAIMPLYDFFSRPADDTTEDIDRLLFSGSISRVSFDTRATADTVLVAQASLLQLRRDDGGTLSAEHVVLVADRLPRRPDYTRVNYDVRRVEKNVQELFGVTPFWVAQTPGIRRTLVELAPQPSRVYEYLRSEIPTSLGLERDDVLTDESTGEEGRS